MWELFVSTRYLLARRRERFISITTLISILGITVGVAALIVVIGVMSGFDEALQNKVIGMNAHLIVVSEVPITAASLAKLEQVNAAAPFVNGQAMLSVGKEAMGVLLKGMNPQEEKRVTDINNYLKLGQLPLEEGAVAVGSELAKRFSAEGGSAYGGGLKVGDKVSFLSLSSKKPVEVKVCGIFTSGMYEYDMNMVFTSIKTAQEILGIGDRISGVAIRLNEPLKAEGLKKEIQARLGYPYFVRTWMDMNRNLFSAIRLEKLVMFIILALIVLVACFNIAGTLIMTVIEKTKDIGILKSIGATNVNIMRIFILEGAFMGITGALLGAGCGFWFARLLAKYPIIEAFGLQEIYYFDRLPVKLHMADFVLVMATAVVISLLATVYPALKAARLSPVETLRYE